MTRISSSAQRKVTDRNIYFGPQRTKWRSAKISTTALGQISLNSVIYTMPDRSDWQYYETTHFNEEQHQNQSPDLPKAAKTHATVVFNKSESMWWQHVSLYDKTVTRALNGKKRGPVQMKSVTLCRITSISQHIGRKKHLRSRTGTVTGADSILACSVWPGSCLSSASEGREDCRDLLSQGACFADRLHFRTKRLLIFASTSTWTLQSEEEGNVCDMYKEYCRERRERRGYCADYVRNGRCYVHYTWYFLFNLYSMLDKLGIESNHDSNSACLSNTFHFLLWCVV